MAEKVFGLGMIFCTFGAIFAWGFGAGLCAFGLCLILAALAAEPPVDKTTHAGHGNE